MATYKTLGIVIKRRNIGEADRLLTVVTQRYGKMTVVAKGVRRTLSKLGSHLEPYNLVNFVMTEGRSLDIITGAVVEKYHRGVADDLEKLSRASRIGEMVDVLTNDREEYPQLFQLVVDSLDYLNRNKSELVDQYFFINALNILGYCPELYECVGCRGKIDPERIGWDHEHGGVVCGGCQKGSSNIEAEGVKILRLFLENGPSVIEKLNVGEKSVRELEDILMGFVKHINQKDLKCDRFWQSIRSQESGVWSKE